MAPTVVDLNEHEMMANPFPLYARLRQDEPVARVKAGRLIRGTGYMVTRYPDVMQIHTDKRFSSNAIENGPAMGKLIGRFAPRMFRLLVDTMVFKDDPDHLRLRSLVNKAFTPRMVAQMEEDVQQVVDTLIEQMAAASGPVDLVDMLAIPLPLRVISAMLGVGEEDRETFHEMIGSFIQRTSNPVQMLLSMPAGNRMVKLFEHMADDRRRNPDDRLLTALVEAKEEGDRLSDAEIVSMIFLLLLAGHDTTANLIGTGTLALLDNPDEMKRLRDHPDLVDSAVEELLRYVSPVTNGAPRIALEDMEMHGTKIPKGSQICGMIISANRDENVFSDSERLDLGRTPNKHLAFAFGSHYCLGNQLARLEARIAFRCLLERFDRIELAVPRDEIRFKLTPTLRGLTSLPLHLS